MPSIRLICATNLTIPQLCVAEREIRAYTFFAVLPLASIAPSHAQAPKVRVFCLVAENLLIRSSEHRGVSGFRAG
jgi:hypothetical protein